LSSDDLRRDVLAACAASSDSGASPDARDVVDALLTALEAGTVRAAEPTDDGWQVSDWVKQGILLAFRVGVNRAQGAEGAFHFRDKDTFPTWDPTRCDRNVRIVPGGSTVRRGAFIGDGVVMMPPSYVNVGAYIGAGSMVDSHALVGSCAQIGQDVHLSAAAQVGGVLEPIGALPVIVEDGAFIGGGCGIYEGAQVGAGAVLAPGVILTRAVPIFDLVREEVIRSGADGVLRLPPRAVVVPGTRPAVGAFARQHGLQLSAPVVVKYRDDSTDAALALEEALR
jgi:2,3,4,5-tetrahydropyridine-2-carboxylate N-succinyltransferase